MASKAELEAVRRVASEVRSCGVAALARAKEEDITAAARALEPAARPRLHVFLATSAIHLEHKLKIRPAQALRQAADAVRFARTAAYDVEFSAEDASRTEYSFLREVAQAVHEAGATVFNVPDTVGYALPDELGAVFGRLRHDVPGLALSAHCHDDLGLAVANSLAAVRAGARQVEVTVNGIGERAGNTSLEELVMALRVRGESARPAQRHQGRGADARQPAAVLDHRHLAAAEQGRGRPQRVRARGRHPSARRAGEPAHVRDHDARQRRRGREPARAGQALGRHAVESRLLALGCRLTPLELDQLTAEVKDLADRKKFVYDEDLLALAGHAPAGSLKLVRYQAVTGSRVLPTATVEIERDGRVRAASAVGNGPLDAALKAADDALGLDLELLELHTRAVTAGKDALAEVSVRVRFDGREATGQAASTDSIEAALKAYLSAAGAARVGAGGRMRPGRGCEGR